METPPRVQTVETLLGFQINQYFLDNPHMVLGEETSEHTQYSWQDYTGA